MLIVFGHFFPNETPFSVWTHVCISKHLMPDLQLRFFCPFIYIQMFTHVTAICNEDMRDDGNGNLWCSGSRIYDET